MTTRPVTHMLSLLFIPLANLALAESVQACAVCFGDPESPMAKGAVMGILVLAGVIGFVLLAVTGTGLYWMQRSRRLAQSSVTDSTHTDTP